MGLLDNIKNVVNEVKTAQPAESRTAEVVFEKVPETLEEFTSLPQAELSDPFDTAALTVLALCVYPVDRDLSLSMLDYLREPRPMNNVEKHLIADKFTEQDYIPRSYFDGAVPENGYSPSVPYTIRISDDEYSYINKGHTSLNVRSGGADSPRKINLRLGEDNRWHLWEQFLLIGVQKPQERRPEPEASSRSRFKAS